MKGDLGRRIRSIAVGLDGTLGVYVHALGTGEQVSVQADQPFPMASVFKIPILAELLCRVHAGERSLEERVTLTDEMKSPGSGVLKEMSAGTALTVGDLAASGCVVLCVPAAWARVSSHRSRATAAAATRMSRLMAPPFPTRRLYGAHNQKTANRTRVMTEFGSHDGSHYVHSITIGSRASTRSRYRPSRACGSWRSRRRR